MPLTVPGLAVPEPVRLLCSVFRTCPARIRVHLGHALDGLWTSPSRTASANEKGLLTQPFFFIDALPDYQAFQPSLRPILFRMPMTPSGITYMNTIRKMP